MSQLHGVREAVPGVGWWSVLIAGFLAAGLVTSWLPLVGLGVFGVAALVAILGRRARGRLALQALVLAHLASYAMIEGVLGILFGFVVLWRHQGLIT